MRGGVDPGGGPVARPKDFTDVVRGMFPLPRVHRRTDDVAHHVTKEAGPGHVDGNQPRDVVLRYLRPEDRADRRDRVAPLPAERAEVVFPDEVR